MAISESRREPSSRVKRLLRTPVSSAEKCERGAIPRHAHNVFPQQRRPFGKARPECDRVGYAQHKILKHVIFPSGHG